MVAENLLQDQQVR
jgi:hypothetical protein